MNKSIVPFLIVLSIGCGKLDTSTRAQEVDKKKESLKNRINTTFRSSKGDSKLSIGDVMIQYFELHQFNEWKDIVEDINSGYDDCCCKKTLNEALMLINIKIMKA